MFSMIYLSCGNRNMNRAYSRNYCCVRDFLVVMIISKARYVLSCPGCTLLLAAYISVTNGKQDIVK